jgi:RimJ/RimL family protein N-acetyltransferase
MAQCGNMRIDTHSNNLPMRRVLEKNGYQYCGIIYVRDGSERLAFQKLADSSV